MKYAFIAEKKVAFPVAASCRALGVSRSGFYDFLAEPETERQRLGCEHLVTPVPPSSHVDHRPDSCTTPTGEAPTRASTTRASSSAQAPSPA